MSHCSASERTKSRGFSLVEVICALAISAMALVVLFRGLSSSQIAASRLEVQQGARVIARSIIDDEHQAPDIETGTRSGDSGLYKWRLTVDPVQLSAVSKLPQGYRLYRLAVEVSWAPRGSFRLDTLKLGK